MEMEAGGPSSKRTRSDEDGGGLDLLSVLPNALLGEIISLLPTKDGARTQVLASRWRPVWRSAPLNLDCNVFRWDERPGIVSRILASHGGPGRCFRIPGGYHRYGADTVDSWIQCPAVDNLQELCLSYPTDGNHSPLPFLSQSILRFSTTLRVATLGHCRLLDSTVQWLNLPQLKKLRLQGVSISECSLQQMIAGFPGLECLLITHSFGFRRVRINSGSIRSIGVRAELCCLPDELKFGELIIKNAPCLEKVLHLDRVSAVHVSVICAPKLETLRCHTSSKISFGSTVIKGVHLDSLATVVHSIKILAVCFDDLSLDTIIDLMKCFPCLEKLYIESSKSAPNNSWLRKHNNLIKCNDFRLKKIVFEMYRGIRSQVKFLTFFISNVRVLESMTIRISAENNNEMFLAEHRRKLENRASRGDLIHFTTDKSFRYAWDIKEVHDLDSTDPFAC
ncbi:unnamed protein product [Alopecurus aequalis]